MEDSNPLYLGLSVGKFVLPLQELQKVRLNNEINKKQAQLRLCKLGPGTVFLIKFFSEIKNLSVALLSQAFLVTGCMLTCTYYSQAKFQLPT